MLLLLSNPSGADMDGDGSVAAGIIEDSDPIPPEWSNTDPTVANAIPDQTATVNTSFSYAFPANTFSDADSGDTLTYTATQGDGGALPVLA